MQYQIRYGNSYCGQDTTFLLRFGYAEVSFDICETKGAYHYVYREDSLTNQICEKNLMGSLDGFREQVDFLLSRKFDEYAEYVLLKRTRYMLLRHSGASSVPELKETSETFFKGICEQVMRCPLSDDLIKNNLPIRGLVKYGENLSFKPYTTPFHKPGMGEYLRRWLHIAGFVCRHPREFPAVLSEFLRTIQRKLDEKI